MAEAQRTPDIRHYQSLAADAAQARPSAVARLTAYERKRLEHEGWSEESIDKFESFRSRVSLLYPLIGEHGGVETPAGQATLFTAFESGCQVLLTRGRKTGRDTAGKPYRPLVIFPVDAIKPYTTSRGANSR